MSFRAAKISYDGSHYIATPKENFPQGHKRRRAVIQPTPKEIEQKEQFNAKPFLRTISYAWRTAKSWVKSARKSLRKCRRQTKNICLSAGECKRKRPFRQGQGALPSATLDGKQRTERIRERPCVSVCFVFAERQNK